MGGIGSGRYWPRVKDTTSKYLALDIRKWQRTSVLREGLVFNWQWLENGEVIASIQVTLESTQAILNYRSRSRGEWRNQSYPIQFDWTACSYGGKRTWFICPAQGCGRRVAILYAGEIFACRHCYQLAYSCQRENEDDRATRQAEKIRRKLNWEPGILNGDGMKPKGMRWRTFKHLATRHAVFEWKILSSLMRLISQLKARSTLKKVANT